MDYTSARAIGAALDDAGFECAAWATHEGVAGAREDGSCSHGKTLVTVTTFDSRGQQDAANEAVKEFAAGVSVHGAMWQVGTVDREQASQVQEVLGGELERSAWDPTASRGLSADTVPSVGYTTLRMEGEVAIGTSHMLGSALLDAMSMNPEDDTVLLDMSEVTFMDWTGAAVLVRTQGRWSSEARRLIVCRPSEPVMHALDVLGVAHLLNITPSAPGPAALSDQ